MTSAPPRAILITGASSGIGAALALHYAGPGIRLALSGRDPSRLAEIARRCTARGAEVQSRLIDVTNRAAMEDWILQTEGLHKLDLVIANAGISAGTGAQGETEAQARAILGTNLEGVLNTLLPILPLFQARRSGQIALIASLAGFRGLAGSPAYCASKAAVRVWGEGLRDWLAQDNVRVSVVCPGFVTSAMTDRNDFPMPWKMEADAAARRIAQGLARNQGRITFPRRLGALIWLLAALPISWSERLTQRLPRKG